MDMRKTPVSRTREIEEMAIRVGAKGAAASLSNELSALVLISGLAMAQQMIRNAEERARRIRPRRAA